MTDRPTRTPEQIMECDRPEDLFGELPMDDPDAALGLLRQWFRAYARENHPDTGGDADVFRQVNELHALAVEAVRSGVYGTDDSKYLRSVVIGTRRHQYRVVGRAHSGDFTNVYEAREGDDRYLLKIARDPRDNDLVAQEGRTIKHLLSDSELYDAISMYVPEFVEAFGYRSPGQRRQRQGIALRAPEDQMYSFETVRDRYPEGVDPKDAAWMFRRLLFALGCAHRRNVIHGAVTPSHITIQPEKHGLILRDWSFAVQQPDDGDAPNIPAMVKRYKDLYPPEVEAQEAPTYGTDIYMAVRCLNYVMGGSFASNSFPETVPMPMRSWMRGCMIAPKHRRPEDAMVLLEEFNEIIERMWGPRRFRTFTM